MPAGHPHAQAGRAGGDAAASRAVRAAANGDSLVSSSITVRLLKHLTATRAPNPAAPPGPQKPLTDRELDVVRLVALGHTNGEIAAWARQTGNAGAPGPRR